MDRFVGTVFNLPLGTAGYGVPPPQNVMSSDGRVVVSLFLDAQIWRDGIYSNKALSI